MSGLRVAAAALAAFAFCAAPIRACDDPVYRYTLEHWPRRFWQVVMYCRAGRSDTTGTEAALSRAVAQRRANIRFDRVDVDALAEAPEEAPVRRVWESQRHRELPLYAVVAPNGAVVWSGPLADDEVERLIRSPQRTRLAELLTAGKEGLLLLLTGADEAEDSGARRTIESALEQARTEGHDVGWMVVDRRDPNEAWLVRQLLAVDGQLPRFRAPMLFGIFGKGSVLRPCVGRQISAPAVERLIAFFKGPCACDELANASRLDLLTDCSWPQADSDSQTEDDRPYYSLLAVPEDRPAEPEPADAAPPPARGLARNTTIAVGALGVAALAAGGLILNMARRRRRA